MTYFITGSSYVLIIFTYFTAPPPAPPPSVTNNFLYLGVYFCWVILFFHFLKISIRSQHIVHHQFQMLCLVFEIPHASEVMDFFDLFLSAQYPLGPSVLLQISSCYSFVQLSNIPGCVCVHIFFIHLSLDTWVASTYCK